MRSLLILLTCLSILHTGFTSTENNACKQEISTHKGRTFLISLITFDGITPFNGVIYIGSGLRGLVNITQHYRNFSAMETKQISPGITQLNMSTSHFVDDTAGIQRTKGVQISSTVDISVYMIGYLSGVVAAYTLFPENTWSSKYVVLPFEPYPSRRNAVMISNLHKTASLQVRKQNLNSLLVNISLHSYESYVLIGRDYKSGAIVKSNKPISLVHESLCAENSEQFSVCDAGMDSLLPAEYWQTEFIIPPLLPKLGNLIKVFALAANETVHIILKNRTNTINQTFTGMYETFLETDALIIITDKKVNVIQYGFSQTHDDNNGDLFMASVPAIRHYGKDYFIPTPLASDGFINTIIVTIRDVHLPGLLLNGKSMDLKAMKTVTPVAPYDNFRIIIMNLTSGNYNLTHPAADARYSVLLYGQTRRNSFGFYLGYTFKTDENNNCSECTNDGQNGALCKTGFPPKQSRGPLCHDCSHVSDPKECDKITICSSNEVCRIEEFPVGENSIFNLGCASVNDCAIEHRSLNPFNQRSVPVCTECCLEDYCNTNCTGRTHNQQQIIVG
ncbi:uncharacterized protein LOC132729650 [Ruditapes philippinarum]|uniref:uncharacterized protein LOC132729650 n=1 Tax=Ruditapes philippinarum TaxID=129788 RepID=UPI00295B580F|nr:uncharacterized protein LOC132729650 [Ruditapes philippinarum]